MALGGKYEIGEQLGGGGMAEVYRASVRGAAGFSRPVAVKRIHPEVSSDERFADMFVNEAKLSSLLHHPNVVSVLDFDRDDDGRLFLVMEMVEGVDLRQLQRSGPIPRGVGVHVVAEALRGLGHAHELTGDGRPLGIVHRDVSPHNVLLSWDGAVKVSDFGIAKAFAATGVTESGLIKGKLSYMSPEQAHALRLDARSDLFAAGVVLHELLTGRPLFGGGTAADVFARLLVRPIPSPRERAPDVPEDLDAVAMRLLARNRDRRFEDARGAIAALRGCGDASADGAEELSRLLRERFPEAAPARAAALLPDPAPAIEAPAVAREESGAESPYGEAPSPTLTLGSDASRAGAATRPERPAARAEPAGQPALPVPAAVSAGRTPPRRARWMIGAIAAGLVGGGVAATIASGAGRSPEPAVGARPAEAPLAAGAEVRTGAADAAPAAASSTVTRAADAARSGDAAAGTRGAPEPGGAGRSGAPDPYDPEDWEVEPGGRGPGEIPIE